ncbi:phospholipid/cholesterol/gamma-HCH transport system substrate-binding protein [Formosa sp. Hel1_31_208]|uniref:MlaD family protein n=1 Tax=Formosa sp. Hel1_31_208 TaxID=1798225 RepID=UPI00087C4FAD|nr:MlaD family protein [Formosa sp. Hel1_31_208]SDS32976.1 phospholipid/cholesterol/gamma-HCH transport system substrate-binding protein [Formosa sp. Hel1_31_208]
MKISREVKTAVLVLSGIILLIFLFNYLKGESLFDSPNTYYTEFDYNALSQSSPVTIKGNAVGKIKDIVYDYETGKTRIAFTVNEQLKFSKQSRIRLYETGLMGGNALAIILSDEGEQAKSGDFLMSEVEEGLVSSLSKNFSGVGDDLGSTLKTADTLLVNLNNLVTDQSEDGLKNAIKELNSTMKTFKSVAISISAFVKNNDDKLASVLNNVDSITKDLSGITKDLKDVKLSETIAELDKTLASVNAVMTSVNNGEGSIGKLLKDEGLYDNLEAASKEMEELIRDIKLHPARYRRILSKKEIPYTPPKEEDRNN